MVTKKIAVEELVEKAYNWFEEMDDGKKSELICAIYMGERNIKKEDVDYG